MFILVTSAHGVQVVGLSGHDGHPSGDVLLPGAPDEE